MKLPHKEGLSIGSVSRVAGAAMAEEESGLLIALCREPTPLWTEMKELLAWLCFHCAKINTYSRRPRREITHQPVDFTGHLIRSCTPQNKTIYCLKRQDFHDQCVFKWGDLAEALSAVHAGKVKMVQKRQSALDFH